ncbi:MAG: flavodoxin family protein [Candidatus Brocadiales bacterium]|nr:flavodoxin family protein [Candidatus Bathyanammoxibius amoris]
MKKLLAIAGSPRRGGNSELLLDEVIRAAGDAGLKTEKLVVSELGISPCMSYGNCWETGDCVIEDKMQEVYRKLLDADYVVVASPLYFLGVSAQLKALIDRCQALWARRFILKKPLRSGDKRPKGLFISTAAISQADDKIFAGSGQTVRAVFSTLEIECAGELFFKGLEKRDTVKSHPEFLKQVYQAARELVKE